MKIVLNMIVKNEEKVIKRCLESALPYISGYVICDTGSTDNTVSIIKETLKEIKGEVHHTEWKNFGHNRTEAINLAKDKGDYMLLLDADQVIEGELPDMTKDCYYVRQQSGGMVYYNTRLLKNGFDWKCVGVTHEYWEAKDIEGEKIDSLTVKELSDGGSRGNKFSRDIDLLEQGLKDEPNNARYMFYLANTYRDIKDYEMAIYWYNKRIEAGGWDEEIWSAMYQKGICRISNHDSTDRIINDLMAAFNYRLWRLEPIYALVRYFRQAEMYITGYWFGRMFGQIQYPTYDILFIEKDVYDWRFYDEIGICCYYAGYKSESERYEKLALEKAPKEDSERINKNLSYAINTVG